MRRVLVVVAALAFLAVLAVLGHFALIEVGREVVTVRTPLPGGAWKETRLWIVDEGASAWLHSGGAAWRDQFANDPVVEIRRRGKTLRCRAHAVPGAHPRVDALLREKYGVADRWVRFLAPDDDETLVVRLDPL